MPRITKTLEEELDLVSRPSDPVYTVMRQSDGTVYKLRDLAADGRRFLIGGAPSADLWLNDIYVSGHHCLMHYQNTQLFVKCLKVKNRTLINGVPIKPRSGYIQLIPGTVLTLGRVELLVCGKDGKEQEAYIAPRMPLFVRRAFRLYGNNKSRAAKRLDVKRRTFVDWLNHKFRWD